MAKQFEDVNSRYGAPMGRRGFGTPEHDESRKIRIFRVRLDSGGYDDGGAYWGHGSPLYCATDGADYRQFVRASHRFGAAALLEIPHARLLKAPPVPGCYGASALEYCGYATPRYVLRYWGEFVSAHDTRAELIEAMQEHYRGRTE